MTLNDTQKNKVAVWLSEGVKLSEIQSRLASEFGLRVTYMDMRLLMDDLKLMPKEAEVPKPLALAGNQTKAAHGTKAISTLGELQAKTDEPTRKAGGVSVTVDQLSRPGAAVSGRVTFSDGNTAEWYLDEFNRLGVVPQKQGYKPSAEDVQQFQMALQEELSKY
jgi:hypothetical protein